MSNTLFVLGTFACSIFTKKLFSVLNKKQSWTLFENVFAVAFDSCKIKIDIFFPNWTNFIFLSKIGYINFSKDVGTENHSMPKQWFNIKKSAF